MVGSLSPVAVYREQGLRAVIEGSWIYALQHSRFAPAIESLLGEPLCEQLIAFPALGYWPRVRYPYSLNEKIIHRKLFTNEPLYATVSDKWAVREYVEAKVGEDVLKEVYHVTDDPATIPFTELPERFVLKPTHGAGWVTVIDDRDEAAFASIREECREWLTESFGAETNEYWYREIEPRIIVEEYIDDGGRAAPLDYKFHVFGGRAEFLEVHFDRFGNHSERLYDRNWEPVSFKYKYPKGPDIEKPDRFDEMLNVAEAIGEDFEYARVDLFNPGGKRVLFGEVTLAPGAGQLGIRPKRYDFELGSYWSDSRDGEERRRRNAPTDTTSGEGLR